MKFFLDTASLKDISWAAQAGLIDGVTTNPSLLAKQAGDLDPKDVLKEICSLVEGPVSAEVVALDTDGMLREGGELAKIADNIVVKIPMTEAGMVAVRRLAVDGIKTNVTLCFSSVQCLIAAKAGASYVSPFIGRLDDVGQEGMDVIREARVIFDNYQIATEILAASIRHPRHVVEAAMIGADVATLPPDVLKKLLLHPLTDRGSREGLGLTYSSPLSQRYASPAMQALWGERRRIGLWRRLWLALMEVERELGADIPERALAELRAHLDDADLERVAEHEKRIRHDVMAHIHHLGEQAPTARPFIHLGATSAYVTDNADLILMREGLQLLLGRVAAVLVALAKPARRYRDVACLAYTHFQPAQLTTVGKRITLWMQELLLDAEELLHRLDTLQFRGVKGTTGTQASFLELFDGDDDKVRELDTRVARKMGFAKLFPVTGQTYTRKLDAQVLAALASVAQSAAKLATDVRLLQHEGEILEPFESDQVGSSAMAYKRNPMRAERITGLARFVIELEGNAWHTASEQWLERTLDDSANRRLVLPEAFLASDAILVLVTNVAAGLEVREAVIARHVAAQLPFLATERLLMRGVKAGGDRQRLHEVIRTHSLAIAQAMAEQGVANDLLERLAKDPAFRTLHVVLAPTELDPAAYVGRAPRQVDDFLERVLPGVLHRIEAVAPAIATAEVNV